jgi:hypothetical protein
MTTHEFARWVDGLRDWLGDGLNKTLAKSLSDFSEAFRDLPDKSLKDLVKDLKALQSAACAVGPLIADMKALHNGEAASADKTLARIDKMKLPELKEICKALALTPKRTISENKALLRSFVEGAHVAKAPANGPPMIAAGSDEIEEGYQEYSGLKNSLASVTIPELRARFDSFRRFSKAALEGIARRLGYHFTGSKEELFNRLLQTLEGMKISQVRGEIIRSL